MTYIDMDIRQIFWRLSFVAGTLIVALFSGMAMKSYSNIVIGLAVAFAGASFTLHHPFAGLLGWLMLSSLDDVLIVSESLTFSKMIGPGLFAAYLIQKNLHEHRTSSIFPLSFQLFLVWNLWGVLSLTWSIAPDVTLQRLTTQAQMLILVFLIVNMVDTPTKARMALLTFAAGGLISTTLGLNAFLAGQSAYRAAASDEQSATTFANIAAASISVFAAFAFYGNQRWRIVFLLATLPAGAAILSAAGRGALVSLFAVSLVLVLGGKKSISRKTLIIVIILTGSLLVWNIANTSGLISDAARYRLNVDVARESGAGNRQEIFEAYIKFVFPKSPIAGYGLGAAPIAHGLNPQAVEATPYGGFKDPHNNLLFILIDLGLIGLGVWLVAHWILYMDIVQVSGKARELGLSDIYWAAVYLMVQMFVSTLSVTYIWQKRYWIAIGLVMMVTKLSHKMSAEPKRNVSISIPTNTRKTTISSSRSS